MHSKQFKFSIFIALIILMNACNGNNISNDNLINKVNFIENR